MLEEGAGPAARDLLAQRHVGGGVLDVAGGQVSDVRNSIRAEYTQEGLGAAVEFSEPPALPG